MSGYPLPKNDGAVNLYEHLEARSTHYWQPHRSVFFINGMSNAPADHRDSAVALSKLQMCRVVGIYNESSGKVADLIQCLGDKWQWDGHGIDRQFNKARTAFLKAFGSPGAAEAALVDTLSRNKAAVALFQQLRKTTGSVDIFAHSQGNLILANVLTVISILDGESGLARFTVNSFGSPTVNWPKGIVHNRNGFTFDPVNWLAGFDSKFSISKVGVPTVKEAIGVVSHGFQCYMADDATFVINRFRWGSFRLTAKMDEEGLATALAQMGTNLPRVTAIFERLYTAHNSDVDDVAELYVNKIKDNPTLLDLIRNDRKLKDLLIKSLDEGWTSSDEYAAIAVLKG